MLTAFLLATVLGCTDVADAVTGVGDANARSPAEIAVDVSPNAVTLMKGESAALEATTNGNGNVSWVSSDPAVATVNGAGKVTGGAAGTASVVASMGEAADTASITVEEPPSVAVSPHSLVLEEGATAQLEATTSQAGSVTWESLDPSIASVNGAGNVTGVAEGGTFVVARVGKAADTASVSVEPEPTVEIAPGSVTLMLGEMKQLKAKKKGKGNVQWESLDTAVATVDEEGMVASKSVGATSVVAHLKNAADTASVTVEPEPSVELSPHSVTLEIGQSQQLDATTSDGSSPSWRSLDTSVATVDGSGLVTGEAEGTTSVVAEIEGAADTASVSVEAPPEPESTVELSPHSVTLEIGQSQRLDATTSDGSSPSWRSLDTSVATVDGSGLVTGEAEGTTNVVAEIEGAVDTASVSVEAAQESTSDGDSGGGTGLVFEDGFEGGLTEDQAGYGWGLLEGSAVGVNYDLTQGSGRGGSDGLRLTFPAKPDGEDAVAQVNFHFGTHLEEVWIEYWMRVPEGYYHRSQDGAVNNKLFQVWGGSRHNETAGLIGELEASKSGEFPGESNLKLIPLDNVTSDGGKFPPVWDAVDPLIATSDRGRWMHWRWHVRLGTPGLENTDGLVELWIDGRLVFSRDDLHVRAADQQGNYLHQGRLFGWSNSGWDEQTSFVIDDFRIYDAGPGW